MIKRLPRAALLAMLPLAVPAMSSAQPSKNSDRVRVIACSGTFARDSSHNKVAQVFGSQTIERTELLDAEGEGYTASVLFPHDPKRRLELVWRNKTALSDIDAITIGLASTSVAPTWAAPGGLKLGMPLTTLEMINGKPFKFVGFDWDNGGAVLDWNGGRFSATLPGGCSIRVWLRLPTPPRSIGYQMSGDDKEFMSHDRLARRAKPVIGIIAITYPP